MDIKYIDTEFIDIETLMKETSKTNLSEKLHQLWKDVINIGYRARRIKKNSWKLIVSNHYEID